MKRSMQEIVELVVFGLIAVLLATGVLWLVGWLLGLVGSALIWLTGLVWAVLRFVVPVAVVAAIVYLVIRLVQQGQDGRAEASRHAPAPTEPAGPADPATAPTTPPGPTEQPSPSQPAGPTEPARPPGPAAPPPAEPAPPETPEPESTAPSTQGDVSHDAGVPLDERSEHDDAAGEPPPRRSGEAEGDR